MEYAFAEYEPGQRFAHHVVTGMGEINHIFEFDAVPEGTRLTQSMIVQPKGIFKLLTPVMKRMMTKRMQTIGSEIQAYFTGGQTT
jgi:hypothetical protein